MRFIDEELIIDQLDGPPGNYSGQPTCVPHCFVCFVCFVRVCISVHVPHLPATLICVMSNRDRLLENQLYSIKLEYAQLTGPAAIRLLWSWSDGLGVDSDPHVVPTDHLFSSAVPISGSPFVMNAV